jgi:transcriptional regulator
MYLRPAFTETDTGRIAALIAEHPFGLLVTNRDGAMDASHLPFSVSHDGDRLTLTAHLAAANPQCAALDGGTALAIFTGPHAYIAPGWYQTQPAVPTWDYAAAHVHGVLEPLPKEADTAATLRTLAADDPKQFDLDAMPPKYRAAMFAGIRAFRLVATRIEAQWKMSQNRSPADRHGVIAALTGQGRTEIAALIAATLPPG